ncbi:hypothetical protein R1sor_005042 [Riccia sorocarpa]|uniref:CCHC-type domain-containing protein n=1 Tax=Riccia sorocarpa TaxID=122646 RepID=A0ABD3HMP3_9MARC
MLTRSGEALGWGKRACQLNYLEETEAVAANTEMAEETNATAAAADANDWRISGNLIRSQGLAEPGMHTNPVISPHQWWEELMRAEAERAAAGWLPNNSAPMLNQGMHHLLSQGGPQSFQGIPGVGTQIGTMHTNGVFIPGGTQAPGAKAPVTNPLTQAQADAPHEQGIPTSGAPNLGRASRAHTLPSLRDIMAEQSQQKLAAMGQGSNSTLNTPIEPQKSYATATAPNTQQPAKPQRQAYTDEEIRRRVAGILETIPKPMERATPSKILKYKLSDEAAEAFGRKTLDLENRGLILYTGGINPLRDTVSKWIQEQFITKLKVNAVQLRVLDRSHYLVILASEEERAKLFNAGPQYLNGRFVEIIPWIADYDTTTLTKKRKPAWVSIAGLSPSLEGEGRKILEKLGKVLHMSGVDQQGRSKFSDVRGMVLLSVEDDQPEAIMIEYEGGSAEFQLYYEFLPEGCYVCHEVGHVARFCPTTTTTREIPQEELDEAIRAANELRKAKEAKADATKNPPEVQPTHTAAEDFTSTASPKQHQKGSSTPKNAIPTQNPFGLLAIPDEENSTESDEEMGDEAEVHQTVRLHSPNSTPVEDHSIDLNKKAEERQKELEQIEVEPVAEDMDTNAAQKRGTYGNTSQEEIHDNNDRNNTSQGKKQRAEVTQLASINQQVATDSPSQNQHQDTQLGVIQGKHWAPVDSTPVENDCQDSQLTDPEEVEQGGEQQRNGITIKPRRGGSERTENQGRSDKQIKRWRIMEQAYTVIDYSQTDRGGTTLIVHPSLQVTNSGIRGNGTAAWVEVETCIGRVNVASIYGPREAIPKGELLTWLRNFNEGGKWFFVDDWNFVTEIIDSVGPTPMLHGSLMRKWRAVDQEWDFLDLRYCAGDRQGPFYTRQATHGDRLDQARLDRVYANDHGLWIHTVTRVKHDGKESASDYIPVLVDLLLDRREPGNRTKRTSYTKMDVESLHDQNFREKVRAEWVEGWNLSPVPTIAWMIS